jgi:hypothetical protein
MKHKYASYNLFLSCTIFVDTRASVPLGGSHGTTMIAVDVKGRLFKLIQVWHIEMGLFFLNIAPKYVYEDIRNLCECGDLASCLSSVDEGLRPNCQADC